MLDVSKRLLYYKRQEIQKAILDAAKDREVGIRYGERGYGKRPDTLMYQNDVLESVKRGATSFHVSEERWTDPMAIDVNLRREELESLRSGWDLVLDIDCPYWLYSKLTAYLFIRALKDHNIKSISCKFSGNKGFHIGVPYEAFPKTVNNLPVHLWFPEGPKKIALYLLHYIQKNLVNVEADDIIFADRFKTTIKKISQTTGKAREELSKKVCTECGTEVKGTSKKTEFVCPRCAMHIAEESLAKVCPKCNILMEKLQYLEEKCLDGGPHKPKDMFDPLALVDVDTILIASRHLYRAPYSMHEKSGLVSVVIDPEDVLEFKKGLAEPNSIKQVRVFLDASDTKDGEATQLLVQAFDFKTTFKQEKKERSYEIPEQAIAAEYFPESIKQGLRGMRDGKKRFLFILINFLKSAGWTHKNIEELVREWNKKNPLPLPENYVVGQLRYSKNKKPVPPPNYDTGIYKDLGLNEPEEIIKKYKNPIMYATVMSRNKKARAGLTEEQKEMRRKYRQRKNEGPQEAAQG